MFHTSALGEFDAVGHCYQCLPECAMCCRVAPAVMAQSSSPPLRVLAYRALALLAPTVPAQQLAPLVPQLLPALLQHLAQADEDSLHLVLELLHVVIESAAAATGGTGLTPEQALAVAQPVLQVRLHRE